MLASTLEPLAEAGADLQVVMGYRYPGRTDKAAIKLHPVSGRKFLLRKYSRKPMGMLKMLLSGHFDTLSCDIV